MLSLLAGIFAVALARGPGIKYGPITQEQIPAVRSYSRVIEGNEFSISYNNPEENEYTLIVFVESKMIDRSSKKLKSDSKGINAQLLYKVTTDGFFSWNWKQTSRRFRSQNRSSEQHSNFCRQ